MGEIVNLRRARKAGRRRRDEARAEENRVRFGMNKAERKSAEQSRALAERQLDGCRLEKAPDEPDDVS
jgi:hypothetical protein